MRSAAVKRTVFDVDMNRTPIREAGNRSMLNRRSEINRKSVPQRPH